MADSQEDGSCECEGRGDVASLAVPVGSLDSLRRYQRRVEHLFDVDVEFSPSSEETTSPVDSCDTVTITADQEVCPGELANTGGDDASCSPSRTHPSAVGRNAVCVRLTSRNQTGASRVDHAREYITSLMLAEKESAFVCGPFPLNTFTSLFDEYDNIERRSRAVVKFSPENCSLLLSGPDMNITLAKLLLEQRVIEVNHRPREESDTCRQDMVKLNLCDSVESSTSDEIRQQLQQHQQHQQQQQHQYQQNEHDMVLKTLSQSGESHDSCYDSDGSPSTSRQNSSSRSGDLHVDVSRAYSDTLRSEHSTSPVIAHGDDDNGEQNKGEKTGGHDYKARVEFALKLGYTESHLQEALQNVGENATQNKLLGELIKLGSSADSEDIHQDDDDDDDDDWSKVSQVGVRERELSPGNVSVQDACEVAVDEAGLQDTDNVKPGVADMTNLRPIVMDGSNVAMSHGNKEVFSCRGIKLAVDWFKQRGHKEITVFVPQWRKEATRPDAPITDQDVLLELEREKVVVFTPARRVAGKRVICYDDRFVIKLAAEIDGIVVSNDNYRDLINEDPRFKKVIEERLLMYSFVRDRFMPPEDPLGRHGPKLDNFLRVEPNVPEPLPPPCPYGKKCTYGNKCKYYHPERGNKPHKMVSERLAEQAKVKIQEVKERAENPAGVVKKSPLGRTKSLTPGQKMPLSRTKSGPPEATSSAEEKPNTKTKVSFTTSDVTSETFLEKSDLLSLNQITLSSESDFEKWKNYNNLLSAHRKRIERAEAQQEKSGQESMSKLTVRFGNDSKPSSVVEPALKRHALPSWSSVDPDKLLVPPQTDRAPNYSSGHLALAKKLSDEREDSASVTTAPQAEEKIEVRARSAIKRPDDPSCNENERQPSNQNQHDNRQNSHRKLNRQLSLKGAEDPRWIQKQMQQQGQLHQSQGHQQVRPSKSDHPQYHSHPATKSYREYSMAGIHNLADPHLKANNADGSQFGQSAGLGGAGELYPHHSHENKDWKDHASVLRMSSAPVTFKSESPHPVQPQQSGKFQRMRRENSISDTQLHLLADDEKMTQTVTSGTVTMRPEEQYGQWPHGMAGMGNSMSLSHQLPQPQTAGGQFYGQGQTMHYLPPPGTVGPVSYHQPAAPHQAFIQQSHAGMPVSAYGGYGNIQSGHHAAMPVMIQQPQLAPSGGGMGRTNSSITRPPRMLSPQYGMPPAAPGMSGIMPVASGMSVGMQRSGSPAALSHPHSIAPPGDSLMLDASRRSASPIQPQFGMQQHHGYQQHQHQRAPASVPVLESHVRQPPFAQESFVQEALIQPTDPRYPLYYHLCGLFPEEKVRSVMNQHPNETNPQLLCAYIIGMPLN